jgi:hypothetical protein
VVGLGVVIGCRFMDNRLVEQSQWSNGGQACAASLLGLFVRDFLLARERRVHAIAGAIFALVAGSSADVPESFEQKRVLSSSATEVFFSCIADWDIWRLTARRSLCASSLSYTIIRATLKALGSKILSSKFGECSPGTELRMFQNRSAPFPQT